MTSALPRCEWAAGAPPLELAYHDEEWGVPQRDPLRLFELLLLEGAQAGLSWSTILRKREGYRAAFAEFDPVRIAAFDDEDVERLVSDARIVRNRAKVGAAIGNARAWLALEEPDAHLWSFVGGRPQQHRYRSVAELPSETEESRAMSRDLRQRGFRFVGPTICYALMQACGMVNDHVVGCFRHDDVRELG
jgi:DNA-3-methyladenine glycosylase I